MNVEAAIREGRCALVFGGRVLQEADVLGELRRRAGIPAFVLSGDAPSPATAVTPNGLAAALQSGGVVCLIEAESSDGAGLTVLANLVAAAPSKPRLVVVAKAFNPFALPTALRMLKFDHAKMRAKEFLFGLPVPEATAAKAAVVAEEPKKKSGGAPKSVFVGREEELATLAEWTSGPIVISGPPGVGKRWLTEKWLAGVERQPDFSVAWGSEADALFARIAQIGVDRGDKRLSEALQAPSSRPAPADLAALAVETLKEADTTLVIGHLDHAMRRDGTFHREGRLETLLRALLLGEYGARVVFLSTIRPRFYREGQGHGLKVLELAGLKGKELHLVFDAYRVEDFAREHFGDISQRIHGHPLAARMFAISIREAEDREELMEKRKFMEMDGIGDTEVVKRRIQKAVEHLSEEERDALHKLAHFRLPFTAQESEITGVKRELRLALLGRGLLDTTPDEAKERVYQVHDLVRSVLDHRAVAVYAYYEALAEQYLAAAEKGTGAKALAAAQEGNRFLYAAHRVRNRKRMPFPDNDPAVESIRGLIRGKKAHPELAEQRIAEIHKIDPANPEVLLLKAELLVGKRAEADAIIATLTEAEKNPTPEVFHVQATVYAAVKGGRGKAATALERGCAVFPDNGRLRRRLAGVYVEQNRFEDAIRVLKEAMELEPMMPDSYGLLGEIYLSLGPARFEDAEAALAEARRLDPDNTLHMARLGALLMETAGEDAAKWEEAQKLLDAAVLADKRNYAAHLFYGRLLIDRDGDLERADWLLKNAGKLDERAAAPLIERARIAVKRGAFIDAVTLLDKATRMEPSAHAGFYVRGEMLFAQGYIFPAVEEFRKALERSPKESAARPKYEKAIAMCAALIASGEAVEMQKRAEAAVGPAPVSPDGGAQRRDPGTTTKRRRRGKGKGEDASGEAAVTADDAAVDGQVAEAVAEADAEAPAGEESVDGHAAEEGTGTVPEATSGDGADGADDAAVDGAGAAPETDADPTSEPTESA